MEAKCEAANCMSTTLRSVLTASPLLLSAARSHRVAPPLLRAMASAAGPDDGVDTPPPLPARLPFPLPLAPGHPSPVLVEEPAGPPAFSVLMLHGWTQNAPVFRDKTHPFVRKLKAAGGRLVYASAPFLVPPSAAGVREDARAWWCYRDLPEEEGEGGAAAVAVAVAGAGPGDPHARFRRPYHCWEESRGYLAGVWAAHGPFHGVVGFSQGAVVAHQLLREVEGWARAAAAGGEVARGFPVPPGCEPLAAAPPAWAVLVCGFPAAHGPALPPGGPAGGGEPRLATPSLHVIGEGDATVPPALQRELLQAFDGGEALVTDKGHAMPQRAADLAAVVGFVRRHTPQPQPQPGPQG